MTEKFVWNYLKKWEFTSWYSVLAGCILIWILSCSQRIADIVTERQNLYSVLLVFFYAVLFFCLVFIKKKTDGKTLLFLIIMAGFLLRAYYVLAAPYNITQHDVGSFAGFEEDVVTSGHFGYIEYIYKNHALPDFDPRSRYSFYNPPGFYIVCAVVLHITRLFGVEAPLCYESLQVVTLFCSNFTVVLGYRILKEFSVSEKWSLLMTSLLALHPFFAIMAVTLNNDCMTMFFMALAMYYTLRWQNAPTMKHILLLGLSLGLAVFTKINSGIICFGIGTVFLFKFWKNRRQWKKYVLQFMLFIIVCAPLALYNPIRNMVKFDVPLTYYHQLDPVGNGNQYITDKPLLSRAGIPSLEQMSYAFASFEPEIEHNIWIQTLRTALFDEITRYWVEDGSMFEAVSLVLVWISALLSVLMNALFVWSMWKKAAMPTELKFFTAVSYASMLIFYAGFCISEPFVCSMNYRYIPVAILFPVIGTALWMQSKEDNTAVKGTKQDIFDRILKNVLLFGILSFVSLSFIVHLELIAYSYIIL